jgi:hypothetical protein
MQYVLTMQPFTHSIKTPNRADLTKKKKAVVYEHAPPTQETNPSIDLYLLQRSFSPRLHLIEKMQRLDCMGYPHSQCHSMCQTNSLAVCILSTQLQFLMTQKQIRPISARNRLIVGYTHALQPLAP